MNIIKILGVAFSILVIIIGIVLFISIYLLNKDLESGCVEIENIARDENAVAYLDQWASSNVLDRGYAYVSGMHRRISARVDGEFISITPLPNESLSRIKTEYFRFKVDTLDKNIDTLITKNNVAQFNFGLGRNQIILLKNGTSLKNYRGDDVKSGHFRQINETTFAYCADAKFKM